MLSALRGLAGKGMHTAMKIIDSLASIPAKHLNATPEPPH